MKQVERIVEELNRWEEYLGGTPEPIRLEQIQILFDEGNHFPQRMLVLLQAGSPGDCDATIYAEFYKFSRNDDLSIEVLTISGDTSVEVLISEGKHRY